MAGMRMQQMGGMQQMGMGGYFMPTMPQPQRFFTPAQIRAQPRWPAQPAGVPRPGPMPGMNMPRAGPARPSAHDDGQTWHGSGPDGSAGETPADVQVHAHRQEPSCPGDAGPDGGSSSTGTAGRPHPGPGAAHRLHVGRRSSPGAEADAG